jgi:hypothetical protein
MTMLWWSWNFAKQVGGDIIENKLYLKACCFQTRSVELKKRFIEPARYWAKYLQWNILMFWGSQATQDAIQDFYV